MFFALFSEAFGIYLKIESNAGKHKILKGYTGNMKTKTIKYVIILSGIALTLLSFTHIGYPGTDKSAPVFLTKPIEKNYVPNEIIVKFKKEAADTLSLDNLAIKHKAKGIRPVFPNFKNNNARMEALISKGRLISEGKLKGINLKQKEEHLMKRLAKAPRGAKIPDLDRIYKIELEQGQSVEEAVADYSKDPNVEYAHPNHLYKMYETPLPQEPYIPNDYYVQGNSGYWREGSWGQSYPDMYGSRKIQAIEAHNLFDKNGNGVFDHGEKMPGEEVIVAVIDTGVDYNHEDSAANIWINTDEISNNGIDDDNNGEIDDVKGWDFSDNDSDPIDYYGHGTHCAGIIAAVGNNTVGVVGVAPAAKIMPVKIFPNATDDVCVAAIRYAADNGADILSNSWGPSDPNPSNPTMEAAIDYAYARGCVIVFAAGNDNDDVANYSPNNYAKVITVAATDSNDQRASFSNYGTKIDVAAPGVDVLSLRAAGTDMYGDGQHFVPQGDAAARYYRSSGTSMACPYVAGLAALLLSNDSTLTNEDVRNIIRGSADDVGDQGFDRYTGNGRVNAYKALLINELCPSYIKELLPDNNGTSLIVNGTAAGALFQRYSLQLIRYEPYAIIWTLDSSMPVINGLLGEIPINSLLDGNYMVRLNVYNQNGRDFLYEKDYREVNLTVSSPSPNVAFNIGTDIQIKGRSVYSYTITWGEGNNPASWSSDGVTVGGGLGVLGSINGNALPQHSGFIILRIADSVGNIVMVQVELRELVLMGWPVHTVGDMYSTPALEDFDNDGKLEIISGCGYIPIPYFGRVYAWKINGAAAAGWVGGKDEVSMSSPAIADIDPDYPGQEVVIGTQDGKIDVWHANGTPLAGWAKNNPDVHVQAGTPAVADLSGDGELEIAASIGGYVYIFHSDGSILPGWPKKLLNTMGSLDGCVVVSDLDGNPKNGLEVIVAASDNNTDGGTVYAWHADGTPVNGWPQKITFPNAVFTYVSSPAVADVDTSYPGLEVFVCAMGDTADKSGIFAWHADGTPVNGWPKIISTLGTNSPSIADMDMDGNLEVVAAGRDGRVYAWHADGTPVNGWPVLADFEQYGNVINMCSPAIADLDGDLNNGLEVVIGTLTGKLYIWHSDGSLMDQWPQTVATMIAASPVIADIDGNGTLELALACEVPNEMNILTLPYNVTDRKPWPMHRQNLGRTGSLVYKPSFSIFGSISDELGQRLPNIDVSIIGHGIVKTDSEGHYLMTGLINGNYFVRPCMQDYLSTPPYQKVVVNGGDVAGVNFVFSKPEHPIADFKAAPILGCKPHDVQFYNKSAGQITNLLWDFGDKTTSSNERFPIHTYSKAGNYTVTLTVSGPGGTDINTKTNLVKVLENGGCLIGQVCDMSTNAPVAGMSITLKNSNGIFADQVTTTDANGNYMFSGVTNYAMSSGGTVSWFTYKMYISAAGYEDYVSDEITFQPANILPFNIILRSTKPIPDFTAVPTSGYMPLNVAFTDASTGSVNSYLWDFGDGGTSTEKNPAHLYTIAGNYTVKLTVSGPGGSATKTKDSYINVMTWYGPGTISGRAYGWSQFTGTTPLAGATITIKPSAYGYGTHDYTTTTDANGNYNVADVIRDTSTSGGAITWVKYTVTASKDGYENFVSAALQFSPTVFSLTCDATLNKINRPPILNPVSNQTVNEMQHLSFTVTATDPDTGDTITYSATGLPQGASFDVNTHIFSWTPNYYQAGKYTVTFKVSDGKLSDSKAVAITVNNVNGPPVINPIGDKTAVRGKLLTFTVNAVDPDGDKVTYGIPNAPADAQFNINSGVFNWNPTARQVGKFVITFIAKDTKGHQDTQTITITVLNAPPVLNPIGDKTVQAGQLLSLTLIARDADPIDAGRLTYSAENLPKGATLNKITGLFIWKPVLTQRGSYKVHFIVNDLAGASDSETITITVR